MSELHLEVANAFGGVSLKVESKPQREDGYLSESASEMSSF